MFRGYGQLLSDVISVTRGSRLLLTARATVLELIRLSFRFVALLGIPFGSYLPAVSIITVELLIDIANVHILTRRLFITSPGMSCILLNEFRFIHNADISVEEQDC